MLTDENKITICSTLDFCFRYNLNSQMKCMEVFQALNRVWNDVNARSDDFEERSPDSIKFRNLLELVLTKERLIEFAKHSSLESLANFSPPIHNDSVLASPFNPEASDTLPQQTLQIATQEHAEFSKYFQRINENPNSKNCREFRNKLCRLLYVIRSNLAHGSKANYQGSPRNEAISNITYSILLQICNFILDNGLYKIAAYGELRRGRRLFAPLIEANDGKFVSKNYIDGALLKLAENTTTFNPDSEFARAEVDILEIPSFAVLSHIDNVECIPRSLVPYFTDDNRIAGFAWVYNSMINLRTPHGVIATHERHTVLEGKATAFMYAIRAIRNRYQHAPKSAETDIKMFGKLIIQKSNAISYQSTELNCQLTSPHAAELIAFIDEIHRQYVSIFDSNDEIMPYSNSITMGIGTVHFDRQHWFVNYPKGKEDQTAKQAFSDMVDMIAEMIAGWMCGLIGDDDALIWEDIKEVDTIN